MSSDIIMRFVNAINEHNTEALADLMTVDHTFIDADGNEVVGKDKMKNGWIGYFNLFPDYRIEITEIFESGNRFGAFGYASGTYIGKKQDKNYFNLPASWKAVVENNKVKLWQVYADSKIPSDIIEGK